MSETDPTLTPGPDDEGMDFDGVEKFLDEQRPVSEWKKERQTAAHHQIFETAQEVRRLIRERLSQVGEEDQEISIRFNYYRIAESLLEAALGVLEEPVEIAGKAIPATQQPEFYEDDRIYPHSFAPEDIDHRIEVSQAQKTVDEIEKGRKPNAAQSHFSSRLVGALNRLGWPGDELQKLLEQKNLSRK